MATRSPTVLEDGWQPTTPVGDTLLRRFVLALAASWEATGRVAGARIHRGEACTAVDVGRPTGLFNSATLLRPLHGEALDRTLDELDDFYNRDGAGRAMLWSPWPTPDLSARGWTLEGHPPMLLRPARPPVEHVPTPELSLVEVASTEGLDRWRTVAVEAFPFEDVDPPDALLGDGVLDDPRFRLVLGQAEGRDVAVGSQFVEHDLNVLVLSATRPETRGRGYYAAIAADRIADQPDLPDAAIVSDDSRPVLVHRFGFLPVTRFTLWVRERPGHPRPPEEADR